MSQAAMPDLPSRGDGGQCPTVRIADATRMIRVGRSRICGFIGEGEVKTIKIGTATLIVVESDYALAQRQRDQTAP